MELLIIYIHHSVLQITVPQLQFDTKQHGDKRRKIFEDISPIVTIKRIQNGIAIRNIRIEGKYSTRKHINIWTKIFNAKHTRKPILRVIDRPLGSLPVVQCRTMKKTTYTTIKVSSNHSGMNTINQFHVTFSSRRTTTKTTKTSSKNQAMRAR